MIGSPEAVAQGYIKGMVSKPGSGEAFSGHHATHTMFVSDEASGVEDLFYRHAIEWADKRFIFGNPNPCTNFFFRGVKGGDQKIKGTSKYLRKVIKIKAEDSPNVRLALAEKKAGKKPSFDRLVPGVLTYEDYLDRRTNWDKIKQCVGLDAEFYEGAEIKLVPPEWFNLAEQLAATQDRDRLGEAIGVDVAEGGDSTVWTVVDHQGIIEQVSVKTPDTSVIKGRTKALAAKHRIDPGMIVFDQGGGGQEHVDYLRHDGFKCRAVSFGEAVTPAATRRKKRWDDKQAEKRQRYTYKNRRAQIYHEIRLRLQPVEGRATFGIPAEYSELRRQLAPLPLLYDEEGRVYLPPKRTKPGSTLESLESILGCSPDEADSLALALFAIMPGSVPLKLGVAF